MSDIIQLLREQDRPVIETGTIEEYLGSSMYRVKIRGRALTVRSAVERSFPVGLRVVINRTESTRYIIGSSGQFDNKERKEVIING